MNLIETLKKAIKFFPQEAGDCVWERNGGSIMNHLCADLSA
jgi:hypothetical protein